MADMDTINLNGTNYSIADSTARTTIETHTAQISTLQNRVATKQDEITWSGDFQYDAETATVQLAAGAAIIVDDALSLTSTNAVQNKIITANLATKQNLIANTNKVHINSNDEIELIPDTVLDISSNNVLTNAALTEAIAKRLSLVTDMPSVPVTDQIVMYIGTDSAYNRFSIYRYSGTAWVELISTVSSAQINSLFN